MTRTTGVHPLDEIGTRADPRAHGGKAAHLARLAARGLPVPPGVVVVATVDDDDLDEAAGQAIERLDAERLAVRSSGLSEDLDEASFAGQFETVLDVPAEPHALLGAICRVRASVHAEHVAAYHHAADERMAVLVMPMLRPDAAGIAFTRDPVTGEDRTVIEAVAGVADALAAGAVDGERWVVEGPDSATARLVSVGRGVLDASQALAVAELARRVEAEAGRPQDVEWAIEGGRLWLLQARALTGRPVAPIPLDDPVPPGPWMRDSVHHRRPMTPLMTSFFPPVFTRGFERLADEMGMPLARLEARVINGYFYVQAVPFGSKPRAGNPPPPFVLRTLHRLLPALRARVRTARRALAERRDRRALETWRTEIRPRALETISGWTFLERGAPDDAALADHLDDALALQRELWEWNVLTDASYLIPLARLVDFADAHAGLGLGDVAPLLAGHDPDGYPYAIDGLAAALRAQPEARAVVEAGGPDALDRLDTHAPDFARRYREHLGRWGLRVLDFDLDAPAVVEDPTLELAAVAALAAKPTRPDRDADGREAALRTRLDGSLHAELDRRLAEARDTYPVREDGDSIHSATWGAIRLAALEAGRRMAEAGHLAQRDDVLLLEVDEILTWLRDGRRDLRDVAERRRGERAWALTHPGPETLGGESVPPPPEAYPEPMRPAMRAMALVMDHDVAGARPDDAHGIAASPGTHLGPVRVVHGPEDFDRVRPGDVLVCPTTASPWEVLFPRIGELVNERGGMLSHPAIVAREHGLPAVLGVADATSRWHDGELVAVDGAAGTVRPADDTLGSG